MEVKSEKLKVELVNFYTTDDYKKNLEKVINIIKNSSSDFLLFPEVCLTGFDYKNWKKANEFGEFTIDELSKIKKAFALSIILENKNYFCFFDNGLIYKRAKYNLFGYEKKFFEVGGKPDIFKWRDLKITSLICFELRFTQYWEKFKGIDLILAPSRWGKERMEHFKTLNKALALSAQSQVLAVNSANEKAYGCSFDAWGEGVEFNNELVTTFIDLEKNKKIRKKLDIGIK
ncbi:carbon-nitrogen hydrolase family protein [Lebetimonas sp. JH292]|uniref:carbon-nitrogen hydrolase family protein n=1 Tax=Lebetimonas sp. JH292 TaxID=990068 RepID=UPI00046631A9|nr:carbon-nitrogen hydrolase family protein [Lebetimonas sp. JH292]